MSLAMDEFKKKFKIEELLILETEYWIWSLRPHQATLGAGVLSLKRECPTFGELNPVEFSDLNCIIKAIEKTLKYAFDYDIMNYLMLMMVDKQVHYHVIPRYESDVHLFDDSWSDADWPGIPNLSGNVLDMDKLMEIHSFIIGNLKD